MPALPSPPSRHVRPWRLSAALAACLFAAVGSAAAATQALVMAIGNYPLREARLKGAQADAKLGDVIARQLGANGQRVTLRDDQLDLDAMRQALIEFKRKLQPGDTAIIYFSGHGVRTSKHGPGCREGLLAFDNRVYFDALLRDDLDAIAETAGRVILFNDSCHAGGAITKQFSLPVPGNDDDDGYQIKSQPLPDEASAAEDCSRPSNLVPKQLRSLAPASRIVYLAAARADEVAFSTPRGSLASQGWAACLSGPDADLDRDGYVTASELTACAQRWIAQQHTGRQQHLIAVMGADERLMKTPRR